MTDDRGIRVEQIENILVVTLARPPVNALTEAVFDEIARVFERLTEHHPGVRAVVLNGEGPHFSAGLDLSVLSALDSVGFLNMQRAAARAFWAIRNCTVPVVGAIHGATLGAGVALIAVCDFVVAASGARIGLPEIKVGVGGGASFLQRLMPTPWVRWMFLTGEPVYAERLHQFGAVLDVVDGGELLERALTEARLVARHSPTALRFAREALNRIEDLPLEAGYEYEQEKTRLLMSHPHSVDAVRAAMEGRTPIYDD